MNLTRAGDYAIRAVLHLSYKTKDGTIHTKKEISEKRQIPYNFLAKIMLQLLNAGIVESIRGIKGGYKLAIDPESLSLLDVIEAIEGPIVFNRCVLSPEECALSGWCEVHPIMLSIRNELVAMLKSITFDKLIKGKAKIPIFHSKK